jgi:hypothetical protein
MDTEANRRLRTAAASATRRARTPQARRRAWKARERAVALEFGGRRVPVTGRARGDAPDIMHPWLCIEVKAWENLPERVHDALHQAEACVVGDKLPMAVIVANGMATRDGLVVMRVKDFQSWFGGDRSDYAVGSDGAAEVIQ